MSGLHDALYQLVSPCAMRCGLRLVFAYQNAARIAKPYATLRVDTITMPGHEVYGLVDGNGMQMLGSWRRAVIELQVYGAGSGDHARGIALALQSESSLQRAQRLDIAIGDRLLLTEVPELLNLSQFEERGIYQFAVLFSDWLIDDVGLIEHVEIDGATDPGGPACALRVSKPGMTWPAPVDEEAAT